MIETLRSRDPKRCWTKGDASGIRADWRGKVRLILCRLDVARDPEEMNIPGFGFHPRSANLADRFAGSVSRNWRITFVFEGENARNVDMEDYRGG